MKTHVLFISFMLLLASMCACNSGSVVTRATGLAYEVVVVMDKAGWDSAAGEAINGELEADIPGLPQVEPTLKVSYVSPEHFDGLLTYVRNILIVKVDAGQYTKVSLNYENNRWAQGQVVLTMTAPNLEMLTSYVANHKNEITNFFVKVEMNRMIAILTKNYSTVVMDQLKSKMDVMLNAPEDMTYYRDSVDFFWASNNAQTGRTDLVVYTFPYTDSLTFTADYLVAQRDSVLKRNLPGAFPDSYMATEMRFGGVDYSAIKLHGKYCGVMRGLWRMTGDMMGGPFVSHIRLDEKNNRVVVAEGFVFAPETQKRNFIRRIEAALFTLRLPGEFDEPVEESLGVTEVK
ncbi:MAG: DUF4837 family protein [Tannerellaceae bacterium]